MANVIPKILHQIWIGPIAPPSSLMETWSEKHPDFEYIFWDEAEIERRQMTFRCQSKIDIMQEWNGKADIMRWEILYRYGGYFVDADSICIEPFDEYFEDATAFATFENETVRDKLIATGTMGFVPGHVLCRDIIDWIDSPEFDAMHGAVRAWGTVGPGLLTRFLETGCYPDFTVFPSHCFLPVHFSGLIYSGHKKVYAYQLWGTSNHTYEEMNSVTLPGFLKPPVFCVSVLVSSYNTPTRYVRECLDSMRTQNGYFRIELVWINDGSTPELALELEAELDRFLRRSRFCSVVYKRADTNRGLSASLREGVELCGNEIVFRMDADDILFPDRMAKQLKFMRDNPECMVCGTNMVSFTETDNGRKVLGKTTEHPVKLTWTQFLGSKPDWFMNHPTLCFYKSAVISIGNYTATRDHSCEDYDLELRFMKKYGAIYNMDETLLYYRIHPGQITQTVGPNVLDIQKLILENILGSPE